MEALTATARPPRTLAWRIAPVACAAAVALAYVVVNIRSADLAAHEFRAALFDLEGFTIWNGQWYGGHHTLGYSVLFPPLAALLSPKVVGAIGVVGAAAAFAALVRDRFGPRARWGALWFGVAAGSMLFDGRLPFALGVGLGVAALLALSRDRAALAAALGAASALASPVAGVFVALAATASALAASDRAARGAAVAAAALAPPLVLALVFPGGGHQPFPLRELLIVEACSLAGLALLPRAERALRIGVVLYMVGALAAYLVPTPLGNNVIRLGALFGGPLLLCVLAGRRLGPLRAVAATLLLLTLAWFQCQPAIGRILKAGGGRDPAGYAGYYEPLRAFLERAGGPPGRLEIPFTATKREIPDVSTEFPLARGWQRQLDVERNALFYDGGLTAERYERWLRENGVRWVAVPDAAPDFSARDEVALVRGGLPYLRERWSNDDWRVYEVVPRPPLAVPSAGAPIVVTALDADEVSLRAHGAGSAVVRVRWTPYWAMKGGCVERAGDWTRVTTRGAGAFTLEARFSPSRLLSRGRRCD